MALVTCEECQSDEIHLEGGPNGDAQEAMFGSQGPFSPTASIAFLQFGSRMGVQ